MRYIFYSIVLLLICPLTVSGQVSISIPEASVQITDTLVLPINVGIENEAELSGLRLEIEYDSTKFEFIGLEEEGAISDSVLALSNIKERTIIISLASTFPIRSSGIVTSLVLKPKVIGFTSLTLAKVRVDENEVQNLNEVSAILITDENGNTPPFIIDVPDSLSMLAGQSLQVQLSDLIGDNEEALSELEVDVSIQDVDVSIVYDTLNTTLTITAPQQEGRGILLVRATDSGGSFVEFSIELIIRIITSSENSEEVVEAFRLDQNYPNPFNPSTNISFELPVASTITLEVYNLIGNKVATLINERLASGSHTANFDASNLSSGIYMYRIQTEDFVQTKKMLLIK